MFVVFFFFGVCGLHMDGARGNGGEGEGLQSRLFKHNYTSRRKIKGKKGDI